MRVDDYAFEFVRFLPNKLADGVLYVSTEFKTAAHRCACGCGSEIVTPLGPTEWKAIYDGDSVSLYPSVGNWHLPCRSHYWMDGGRIVWAEAWTDEEVEDSRAWDRERRAGYFLRKGFNLDRSDTQDRLRQAAAGGDTNDKS